MSFDPAHVGGPPPRLIKDDGWMRRSYWQAWYAPSAGQGFSLR